MNVDEEVFIIGGSYKLKYEKDEDKVYELLAVNRNNKTGVLKRGSGQIISKLENLIIVH